MRVSERERERKLLRSPIKTVEKKAAEERRERERELWKSPIKQDQHIAAEVKSESKNC